MALYKAPTDPDEIIRIDPDTGPVRRPQTSSLRGTKVESGLRRSEQLQEDVTGRLQNIRGRRQELSDVAAQPALQSLSEQAGAAGRTVGMEGSLGEQRRSEIGMDKALGAQQIKSQSFMQQLGSEQGVQALQEDFTNMFNAMNQEDFTREIQGLGEEVDRYMASEGRKLQYERLAQEARESTNRMIGRFANSIGQEVQRSSRDQTTRYGREL